ncbi:phosphatase PAP2 family protein [Actinomyces faecalis]|uniref:phosphatase PAP2 family protein n=1 Tax=Actinomyces faecalis TaxID=2722820 RepID=UPI001554280D|nr:phosphatase PAP2 family protein [Actinomyces faecalis]
MTGQPPRQHAARSTPARQDPAVAARRPPRSLAPVLAAGAAIALAAFAVLADGAVKGDDLSTYDPSVTGWMVASRRGWLTDLAWIATHLGGALSLTVITVVAAVAFVWTGRRRHAVVLVAAMASSSLVTVVLKLLFARQRPSIELLLGDPASTFSFPSGHSFNSAVMAGTLAGFVVFSQVSLQRRILAGALAVLMAGTVGLSRVYLAYHWLTDVLAGWSLAVAWLCLAALLVLWTGRLRPARAQPR